MVAMVWRTIATIATMEREGPAGRGSGFGGSFLAAVELVPTLLFSEAESRASSTTSLFTRSRGTTMTQQVARHRPATLGRLHLTARFDLSDPKGPLYFLDNSKGFWTTGADFTVVHLSLDSVEKGAAWAMAPVIWLGRTPETLPIDDPRSDAEPATGRPRVPRVGNAGINMAEGATYAFGGWQLVRNSNTLCTLFNTNVEPPREMGGTEGCFYNFCTAVHFEGRIYLSHDPTILNREPPY